MANLYLISIYLIVLLTIVHSDDDFMTKQPDFLPVCQISDPEFTKCSTRSIQSIFKQLSIGIPGLKTLDTIDPFYIDKIHFNQNQNDLINLKAEVNQLNVTGLANTVIKQSKVNKKDFSWNTKVFIPKLRINGQYKMKGRVLLLPLEGAGKVFLETKNLDILMHTKTRLYEKGGFTFYNVTSVKIDLKLEHFKANLENLFSNNQDLGNNINEFFNQNWRDFFEAVRPIVTDTIETLLLSVLQQVFHYIPANFFVSDIPTSVQLYGQ